MILNPFIDNLTPIYSAQLADRVLCQLVSRESSTFAGCISLYTISGFNSPVSRYRMLVMDC